MQTFTATLKKFITQGEKTGWTYLEIPADISELIKPGWKKSYRVKGKLDNLKIESVSTVPMGGGQFIIAVNATMRKAIGKNKGAMVKVQLQEDKQALKICEELLDCLRDEPEAMASFDKQPTSHKRYFNNWIGSAKTDITRAKRIAMTVSAMLRGMNYGEMIRESTEKRR